MSEPWGEDKHFKTQSAYYNWIRGVIRKGWTRYPPQNQYKASRSIRVPVLDENGNKKYYKSGKKKGGLVTRLECPCDMCGKTFPSSKVQVDHVVPVGSFTKPEHIKDYILGMFCSEDNWQLLCTNCHPIKSYADAHGIPIEEAKKAKDLINKLNQPVSVQKQELREAGFTDKQISNEEKRKECYKKLLKQEDT